MKMKKKLTLILFLLGFFGCLISTSALAQSFSADMFYKEEGKEEQVSKFYMSGDLYTYELSLFNGPKICYIVNRKARTTIMLNLNEKTYTEIPDVDLVLAAQDIMLKSFKEYKLINEGEEEIGGLICEKRVIKWNMKTIVGDEVVEEKVMIISRAWISKKYNIPIKMINYKGDKEYLIFELKNIKETPVEPKIFEVPEGYKKVEF